MERVVADIIHPIACGLDVHSAVIVACLVRPGPRGGPSYEERHFQTTLRGLGELRDWLLAAGCQAVGMEATGVFWIPVYSVLEGHVLMVVGNPSHMANLRGHKTDRKDASLSNIFGVSGMGILDALAEGRNVLDELPNLLYRTVRGKKEAISAALEAGLRDAIRPLLALHLNRLEALEENIQKVEQLIAKHLSPYEDRLNLLMTIPGVSLISASVIVAEIGIDMSQWPTAKHLSAWGGVAPGCRESGGKFKKTKTLKGNPYVCTTLVECAGAAVKKKNCQFSGLFRHLCARTGNKMKARMAVARKLLVIVYGILTTLQPYVERKLKEPSAKSREKTIRRHILELKKLGVELPGLCVTVLI